MPAWVEGGEAKVWCEDAGLFAALVDEAVEVAAARGHALRVTFDDGNVSDLSIGVPVLAARGLSGAFFVCAGRIGLPGYLDGAMLREMRAAGMEIGSHGWGHVDWRRADAATMAREIGAANDRIAQELGAPVTAAAVPFGSYDRRAIARAAPFARIYTSDGGLARASARIQPRWSYSAGWGPGTVAAKVTAGESAAARLRLAAAMLVKRLR